MGEAADEAEARLAIAREHGWAETEAEGWWFVKEAVNRPYRGTHYRKPRGLWTLPPAQT